jgi:hypothetical protein
MKLKVNAILIIKAELLAITTEFVSLNSMATPITIVGWQMEN